MVCNFQECQDCPIKVKKTGDARWTERIDIIHGAGNSINPTMLIVIDAPFRDDSSMGELLIAGSSTQIERLLNIAGISMDDVYIVPAARCYASWTPIRKELEACKPHLSLDIRELNPKVIVPMGGSSLWSITGKEKITDQRGSMVDTEWGIPCVPTFSPASIYHSAGNERAIINDFQKAWRIANGDEVTGLGEYTTCRTIEEAMLIKEILLSSDGFSFDFETSSLNPRQTDNECECCNIPVILCASFADQSGVGYTIPLFGQFLAQIWAPEEFEIVKQIIIDILDNDIFKIAANGKFDIEWAMYYLGLDMGYDFDVQYAFAMVNEERPHSLEHQRTIYTNMPRYEAFKDDPEIKALIKEHGYAGIPEENLWEYAAADADLTYRCYIANIERMFKESKKAGGAMSNKKRKKEQW